MKVDKKLILKSSIIMSCVSANGFIRDWITSRYLDQVQTIKNYKKEIVKLNLK